MKNLIKKSATQNQSSFAHFATARINSQQLKMVKGGDDATEVIIVEDVIVG